MINFYKGIKEKYNSLVHSGGLYFTTDTHEIIANNSTYGEAIDSWTLADGVLTLTMTSGKTVEITFDEATENAKGLLSASDKKKINSLDSAIADAKKAGTDAQSNINTHKADTSNPHKVTKALVGLDKVNNTADSDKVVASAGKLTTPRIIWGLSFDGTSDINGDITLNGAIITYDEDAQLIDLGLPSGTLWMDRNVGASSPSDYGLYFAWGETDGYTADEVGSKKQFSWADYKYANGADNELTKYCNNSIYGNDGYTDSLVTLETTDDMVLQNVHKYSMPTTAQLQELLDNTTFKWTAQDGVKGMLFTSKTNGNSIFVPAAGYGSNGSMHVVGSYGHLWSSSLGESSPSNAWYLRFYNGIAYMYDDIYLLYRCSGFSVRGVATPSEKTQKTINLPSTSGTLALDNIATDTTDGLMSKESYNDLQAVKTTLNGVTNVKDSINKVNNYVGNIKSWDDISKLSTTSTSDEIVSAFTIYLNDTSIAITASDINNILNDCITNGKFLHNNATGSKIQVETISNLLVLTHICNIVRTTNTNGVDTRPILQTISIKYDSSKGFTVIENPLTYYVYESSIKTFDTWDDYNNYVSTELFVKDITNICCKFIYYSEDTDNYSSINFSLSLDGKYCKQIAIIGSSTHNRLITFKDNTRNEIEEIGSWT